MCDDMWVLFISILLLLIYFSLDFAFFKINIVLLYMSGSSIFIEPPEVEIYGYFNANLKTRWRCISNITKFKRQRLQFFI